MFSIFENLGKRKRQNEILRTLRGKRTVILIAGHHRAGPMNRFPFWHPADPGALRPFSLMNGSEHDECEKIVTTARNILLRDGFNAIVCPFDLNLNQKIEWVNKNFPAESVLFSVHLNHSHLQSATGTETWYLAESKRGAKIAREIQKSLVQKLRLPDRGIKPDITSHHGRLGILRDTKTYDEWLVELGFITAKTSFARSDMDMIKVHGAQAVADAAKLAFYE